jgi:hypothetical protein
MLADVFGVSLDEPSWLAWPHYVAPTEAGQVHFGDFSRQYPAYVRGPGQRVTAYANAKILATTTLPWPAPDPSQFSSIHSNPPWHATSRPEVVLNRFGTGKAIYCSSPLETVDGLSQTFIKLLRLLNPRYQFEADAPASVEVTLFHQPEQHRYRLTLVSFQRDLPNIPVENIRIRLRLPGQHVRQVVQLPDRRPIPHQEQDGVIHLQIPHLETLAMFLVEVA